MSFFGVLVTFSKDEENRNASKIYKQAVDAFVNVLLYCSSAGKVF